MVRRLAGLYPRAIVVVLDRFSSYQIGAAHPFHEYANVEIVPGNFFNRNEVADAVQNATYVFHLISTTNPATSSDDPFVDLDTNVRSSIELFDICVQKGVQKVIFFSSGGSVYGDGGDKPINETAAPLPRSPYAIGKLTIENYLRYFKYTHGLHYVIYRVANPYGPGQNIYGKQGVIPIFMNKFLHNGPLTIFGDGSMVRDYIYIDDLVEMVVQSFAKDTQHTLYNIGSGNGASVNELISALEATTGIKPRRKHLEVPPTYVHKILLDIDRFTKEFGWRPRLTLEEGIRETWNYVKEL